MLSWVAGKCRAVALAFWAAVRGWIATHRNGIAPTSSLLSALDAATPIDLGQTLFAPRFPRLY